MRNKKGKMFAATLCGTLLFGTLLGFTVKTIHEYKYGDYVPEEDAYFVEKIDDEAGKVKAHKFVTPTDNKYSSQLTRSMGASLIGDIESVWDSYTGEGTTVAIIDDGFDVNHPEYLRENGTSAILSTSRYYYSSGNYAYYKEYSSDPTCIDEDWEEVDTDEYKWATHGTNTSTTTAAPMNNGGGVGIAPGANILALKIDFSFVAIKAAIQYAVNQKVDVINMSLGAYAESFTDGWGEYQEWDSSISSYLNSACQSAYNAGVIVIAAAGNESTWHKSYPACNSKVIGVGAIGDWNNKGNANELAEFTNYVGSSQTGEVNVDILAPGYVYTATKDGTENNVSHTYSDTQGTSFSSPIVAGAACLWKQKYPNGTPDQFLEQLQASADGIGYYTNKMIPVSGWSSKLKDVGPSNIENGRLNVARLMDIDNPFVSTVQSSLSISVGEKKQIDLDTYNGVITYSSSDTNIATVSDSGLVEGTGAGDATITVTATKNDNTATATVTVHVAEAVAATAIEFNPNSIDLVVGATYESEPAITVTPSNASRIFMFESYDPTVATVDEDTGLVTAVGEGTTKIYAVAGYGDGDDELEVNVTKPVVPSTESVTYTVQSTTSATITSGTAPDGTSVTFKNTYSTKDQMTSGEKQTWTWKGYKDYVITSIKTSMHRNSTNGKGSLSLQNNGSSISLAKSISTTDELTSSYEEYELLSGKFTVNGDVVLTITSSQNSIYCNYIVLTYELVDTSDKIVNSLAATYSGGDVYVGDSLDNSKVSVTASFTNSGKYPSEVLETSDYSLSGFSSSTSGNKTVTVTYTGSLTTSSTPLTTSFNVNVIDDSVSDVSVTNNKTYHPGETIVKSDLTVTLEFTSGKYETTTDFTFASDGYQFTYSDAQSGGAVANKQFSVSYDETNYNFSVKVSRVAPQTINTKTTNLATEQFGQSDLSKSSGTASSESVTIGGIGFTVTTNAYVYYVGGVNYISFGSGIGSINNTNAFDNDLVSVSVVQKSSARQDGALTISKDGTNYVSYSTSEIAKGGYRFFKYAYTTNSTGSGGAAYSNIQRITFELEGQDYPTNVANYIMYEDTNGQCVSKLDVAIKKLNTMTAANKTTFWTSDNYVIATARERLEAWARHEGKELTFENDSFVVNSKNRMPTNTSVATYTVPVIIIASTVISLIILGGYFLITHKKEEK